MAEERTPFADVVREKGAVTIPEMKWRELVFIGAMKRDGEAWVRDPGRPMPPFRDGDPFPEGIRFLVETLEGRTRVRPEQPGGSRYNPPVRTRE